MKSIQSIKYSLILAFLALSLQACSVFELLPPEGFPAYENKGAGYVPLGMEGEFDFHQNPMIK